MQKRINIKTSEIIIGTYSGFSSSFSIITYTFITEVVFQRGVIRGQWCREKHVLLTTFKGGYIIIIFYIIL